MKLAQFLDGKSQTEFEVVRTEMEVTESNGEKVAVLYLKNPIPVVQGSQSATDDASGESERLQAYDVEVVRIHQRDFDAEGIELNKDGTGIVKTSLRLDVSNRGDVWMTSKSFAAFAREKRQERSQVRKSGILTKMNERKAAALLKNANNTPGTASVPEAVAAKNGKAEEVIP